MSNEMTKPEIALEEAREDLKEKAYQHWYKTDGSYPFYSGFDAGFDSVLNSAAALQARVDVLEKALGEYADELQWSNGNYFKAGPLRCGHDIARAALDQTTRETPGEKI